jgi:hypothetical protein
MHGRSWVVVMRVMTISSSKQPFLPISPIFLAFSPRDSKFTTLNITVPCYFHILPEVPLYLLCWLCKKRLFISVVE